MWIDKNLSSDVAARIESLCAEGDQLADRRAAVEAIEKFQEAFDLLPTPAHQWVAATWILVAIGDTQYLAGEVEAADGTFREVVMSGRGWQTNPFIWLRRGQIAFDLQDLKKAADCLASAFMLAGYDLFTKEDEKYAVFVLGQLDSPVPPVSHPLARFHRDAKARAASSGSRPWWRFW